MLRVNMRLRGWIRVGITIHLEGDAATRRHLQPRRRLRRQPRFRHLGFGQADPHRREVTNLGLITPSTRARRLARAAVVTGVVAGALLAAVVAAAADNQAAWHKVAVQAKFPVYQPRQTLGLEFDGVLLTRYYGCLEARWGNLRSSKARQFGVYEPAGTSMCGQPGVATQVATAVISGVKVQVLVQCATWPRCTIKDGETRGEFLLFVPEHGAKHYTIQLDSVHVSLSDFLKVARSFTRVR
jgi:hypothetical protein